MSEALQNIIMTVVLFPISMALVGLYMWVFGPYSRRLYWGVVGASYLVMLFVCWGVELGYLSALIR